MIATPGELAALLRPVPLTGEALRFGLGNFRSTVTRELLMIRMRRQGEVFGTGGPPIPARLSADGAWLEVDADALMAANAIAARRIAAPEGALDMLRRFARAERALDTAAAAFERAPAAETPSIDAFCAYVDANTVHQELGALKFCLPADLRARVAAIVGEHADALLAPERPSLWSMLHARDLALARARRAGSPNRYRRALAGYRRSVGYLGAEDVDFAEHEPIDVIDARIAAMGSGAEIAAARAALAAARDRDRAARRVAAARFAAARPEPALVALVLLARTLAAHEDRNRRGKMRLLRDLRDLAARASLPIARAHLIDLAAACRAPPQDHGWQRAQP